MTIFIAAVISMIVGAVWYGPLFGKRWMEINGMTSMSEEQKKDAQKNMMMSYGIQFAFSLLQIYVLSGFLKEVAETGENANSITVALWLWLGFVVPTLAASALWNARTIRTKREMFLIQAGYNFVMFIIYAIMFGA